MKLNNFLNLAFITGFSDGLSLSSVNEHLNIAVSITFGTRSHAKYLFEIIEVLARRGHSISYLCSENTLKFSKGYNTSHIIMSDKDLGASGIEMKPFTRNSRRIAIEKIIETQANIYHQSFGLYEIYYKEKRPDLIICDWASPSCIDSAAKFSIPMIIGYQSLYFTEKKPYLTTSDGLESTTIENYSFLERFYHGAIQPIRNLIRYYSALIELKRARLENGVPATIKLIQFTNMGLGIANSYIGFENPRALASNLYPIGPISPETLPSLSDDLQPFFDSHKKILYIAFGSLVRFKNDISTNMLEHFQRLLNDGWIDGIVWGGMANTNTSEFPKTYTVDNIEYSTEPILDGTHEQFKLLKWAPQDAILNHSHTKLFITHGGLDSIYESIQSGTPMLTIPYLHGIGDYIEWPIDGDDLINRKLVKLLDPSNIELKANIEQFQAISKFSSNRKLFAADLIETYANSAKICRRSHTPKSFEIPCEVKPFLPLDQQMSGIKANLIDWV
ncbi:glycosyltransferase family 1 protein [Conidiobolus coronatus NRRL 28638]|uniref:Glycosyltransferase family 1 protein n=1 Tax=Conidiobolus coronatus (strain ATCC 28846 / CBS 209.66 / NRRL 28638) TaxID=796925 RepID=A0A137P195_CONC2|nr:glycosyltransferase family 1 protein [Conidiobolus coronatus NRRL 28638]|eukprot:KXN68641.1 glycosyltransferase family 1 protein [Conidiobolus coronatus NRRL 28638]